jgi:chemotaxis protein methyltransferase CheR
VSAVVTDDYLAFCDGVREICGIDLTQYKRRQMERRLRSFFERRGVNRLTDSLQRLREDASELDALLDHVTINVSRLWRHPEQWRRLERDVLPALASPDKLLTAWSAGCSYGAEAYTLAAVCCHSMPGAPVRIVGTDIDRRMVARAKTGEFSDEDAHDAPIAALELFFDRIPGGWRAKDELRALVRFERGDLLRMTPHAHAYDLILCRNTVIYFAEPIRDELHARLVRALRPGGYLVIGATERVSASADLGLEPVYPFIFRKA